MADREVDVLIVGAGTAGTYMAWKLAAAGHECLVLEKEALTELGRAIGPFHMEETAFERFGIPRPEGEELLHVVDDITMWAPGGRHSVSFRFPTMVMDKPLFIQRMHRYARDAGAEIVERASVDRLIFEGGVLRGAVARGESGGFAVRSRLVLDASGIDGAVRARMPAGPWFENEPTSAEDTIFVYMETLEDVETPLPPGVNSYPYYQGWCAPAAGGAMIVGIGMAGSFEAARERHRRFREVVPVRGRVADSTAGRIPYRRPPFSLVDNRLMVLGDAARMNKPFSGEGVVSGFAGCDIAVGVASGALARDDLTREGLWRLNVDYFRGQGAKFAFLNAVLPALMAMEPGEMDLFFEAGFMTAESSLAMQEDYEVVSDPGAALKGLPALARGLASGVLKPSSLARIARTGLAAARLKSLYESFPAESLGFGAWLDRARPLWQRVEEVRHDYFAGVQAVQ